MSLFTMKTGRRVKNRIPDNRGISLLELIAVISIMVVITGVASMSLAFMFTRDANYVAVRIDDELAEARMLSTSKNGEFTYVLHFDNTAPTTGYIRIDQTITPGSPTEYKKVMLNKSVTINVTGADVPTSGDVAFVFSKRNGSLSKVGTPGGTMKKASGIYTIEVTSTRNTSKKKDVTIISTTGRHYTEK